MNTDKQAALAAVDAKAALVTEVADCIWDYAELSLQEVRSAEKYCAVLEAEGFTVERGICGISTAFSAAYGSGRPVIGLLAEYDALSGLSQEGGALERKERVPGGCGHGCGHNLLGAGSLAAAVAVKDYMEQNGIKGSVHYFGCPGEEFGCGKMFMARAGAFDGIDAAFTWHPSNLNSV